MNQLEHNFDVISYLTNYGSPNDSILMEKSLPVRFNNKTKLVTRLEYICYNQYLLTFHFCTDRILKKKCKISSGS